MEPAKPQFFGDQVLFDTGTFMHDAMISREVAAAVAQGAVGRVWEGLKVMVFTFGGSSHTKYMGYLLEMIVDLELESNSFLKDANLLSMVLNPDGSDEVQRKDSEYGAHHIRDIWSRNVKDIYDLKNDFRAGLGLGKRSGRHKKPHERPEVKILLREYREAELHKRRPGRTFEDGRNVDNFSAGIQVLAGGALKKWTKRTTNSRIQQLQQNPLAPSSQTEDSEHESDWSNDEEDEEPETMTPGDTYFRDGELIIDTGDDDDDDILAGLEELAGGLGAQQSDDEDYE
ncbi:hypothetical protein DFH09DRAFT_951259 [Mycena vulgaris]|nr:hypothetical protein DFH09DRAFT_951259 [Mycena vulgaris]